MSNEKNFVGFLYSDKNNGVALMKVAQGYTDMIHQLTLDYLKISEENEKLVLDLQEKKKIISNLEEDIKLMQSNVIDKEVLFEEVREASLNSIMGDFKSGGEISDYILEILYPKLCEENETLKELLNIGKDMKEELNRYKEKYSKLKAKVNTIYGNSQVLGDISLEEANNLKKENEKLKVDKSELKLRVHYLEERICDNSLKSSEENQILKEENERLKENVKSAQEFAVHTRIYHVEKCDKLREENEKIEHILNGYKTTCCVKISDNLCLKQRIHEAFNELTLYFIDRRTQSNVNSHILKAMNILE